VRCAARYPTAASARIGRRDLRRQVRLVSERCPRGHRSVESCLTAPPRGMHCAMPVPG
jgi:hypothetical protein